MVSIHAPTRGATRIILRQQSKLISFNPRTHAGCDMAVSRWLSTARLFQSTHPRGVRHHLFGTLLNRPSFNPRTHAGCDPLETIFATPKRMFQSTHPRGVRLSGMQREGIKRTVSIHAPTRGATIRQGRLGIIKVFQSTHPRGVRPPLPGTCKPRPCFNPRTHAGCDNDFEFSRAELTVFQSTHPRGVRRAAEKIPPRPQKSFNPRTHAGCDSFASSRANLRMWFQSTHPRGVRQLL